MAATQAISRSFAGIAGCLGLGLSLCSCADTLGSQAPSAPAAQAVSIRPSGLSPRPAALAVTQMEGAPMPLQTEFMALFNADVTQQDVALTDSSSARYLARGYISAFPVDGGAKLTYVWDIYDRTNHRAQRLNDEIALKGAAADPWTLVDGAALAALAARSAQELAAYLSNTPEAVAAAAQEAIPQTAAQDALPQAPTAPDALPPQVAPQPLPAQALSYSGQR